MYKVWAFTRLLLLIVSVTATLYLSYWLTCGYELATACFAGVAVVAAILAYRSQEQQRRSTYLETRRSQIWASFDSMMQLAESRRPSSSLVPTLNGSLQALELESETLPDALFNTLQAQWSVVEYWIVIGSWCNLMFTKEFEEMQNDRNAVATLLVGSLGSDHVAALVEYAARSSKAAFYPLIFLLWLHGGVRDVYATNEADSALLDAVDNNMIRYAKMRAGA